MARAYGSIAQWLTIRKQVDGHTVRWYRHTRGVTEPCRHQSRNGPGRRYSFVPRQRNSGSIRVIPFGVVQPSAEAPVQF
jgi:hypothetical protein